MRRSRVRLLVAAPVLSEPTFVLDWPSVGDCFRSSNEFLSFGGIPERSKGSDCKSDGYAFEGSNPSPATIKGRCCCFGQKGHNISSKMRLIAGMVQW